MTFQKRGLKACTQSGTSRDRLHLYKRLAAFFARARSFSSFQRGMPASIVPIVEPFTKEIIPIGPSIAASPTPITARAFSRAPNCSSPALLDGLSLMPMTMDLPEAFL